MNRAVAAIHSGAGPHPPNPGAGLSAHGLGSESRPSLRCHGPGQQIPHSAAIRNQVSGTMCGGRVGHSSLHQVCVITN